MGSMRILEGFDEDSVRLLSWYRNKGSERVLYGFCKAF